MTNPEYAPMVVLRSGDSVLLTLTEDLDPEEVADMTATLRDVFPGVEFVVATGVRQVVVGTR